MRIKATDFNSWQDAVAKLAAMIERQDIAGGLPLRTSVVLVKNTTNYKIDRFGIIGLSGIVISPTANELEFCANFALEGAGPTVGEHEGKFAVYLEPCPVGEIRRAVLSGVTVCRLDVQAEADAYAEIADGDTTKLKTGTSGSARILWKEDGLTSGSGTGKWGVIRIGEAGGGKVEFGKTKYAFNADTSIALDPCDQDGTDNGKPDVLVDLVFQGPAATDTFELPIPADTLVRWVRYETQRSDGTTLIDGVVIGLPGINYTTPYVMLADQSTTELDAQTDTWDRDDPPADTNGVQYSGPRVVYDTATETYFQFFRTKTYDNYGGLAKISAETKATIIDLVNCTTV